MRLEGKMALVTGGGRGLGEAICRTLAREGAHIAVGDINLADATRGRIPAAEYKQWIPSGPTTGPRDQGRRILIDGNGRS